jgi:hypothetical protein
VLLSTILLLLAFGTALSYSKNNDFTLLTKTSTFVAGQKVELAFSSTSKTATPELYIIHSYGKTLLESKNQNGTNIFEIPAIYTQKMGTISWFLINPEANELNSTIQIVPNNNTKTQIENYLGPRSILAGGADFTMMVSVPTDGYDNPKPDETPIVIKHQFLNDITTETKKTKNFIAWKNIYSSIKSGQILSSTSSEKTVSKEIETEVYPNIATDFSISYSRNHDYADGNQITTISSAVIKDQFNNIVSDGTSVLFTISTKNKLLLKTYGTTINGIATGQILHPDHADTFIIIGYVTGIAKSNTLILIYKPIISSFNYLFSKNNRQITVGPVTSFMGQLVPDGIKVTLKIFDENKLVNTLFDETSKGIARFSIPPDFYTEKQYHFEISILGLTMKIKSKNYDTNKQ